MKVVSIVGARPQFIKAAPVSRVLRQVARELLVHTGQHYDHQMSAVFFEELHIPEPDYNLDVGSGSHGRQTGEMLIRIEKVFYEERPDWVLVYGDTNSTMAGALAAVKLQIPVAHVEAGLRSFNRRMPEEHNRVLTDHLADLLFCPTQTAVNNLTREGISSGVHLVGDVMFDAVNYNIAVAEDRSSILARLGIESRGYALATVHRPHNTDHPERLRSILTAFAELGFPVIFPVHPRTRDRMAQFDLGDWQREARNVLLIEPTGYMDTLILEKYARVILTDSGGVQKEAYMLGVPCVTLREETEWVETVEAGWNILAGAKASDIIRAVHDFRPEGAPPPLFSNGHASERIVKLLIDQKPQVQERQT